MSSSVNVFRNMVSFDKAEQFDGYSKVIIIVSDETEYSAGTETGRTLTLNCPWGTQEIANNILQSIKGFQYQPMTAEDALVDPSVEIGDGISANGVYSGVYSLETKFDSNLPTSISAPADEELYEEHTYIQKTEREVTRKFINVQSQLKIQDGKISAEVEERKSDIGTIKSTLEVQADKIAAEVSSREKDVSELRASVKLNTDNISAEISARTNEVSELRASLNIQAGQIEAKVSKSGGSSASFAWDMQPEYMSFAARGSEVFRIDRTGAYVYGIIRATGGKIGGFDIQSNYLSYNGHTWGGTNTIGIYAGPSGIQCGSAKNGVRITSSGDLYAENGYFRGSVNAGNIQYGENGEGYLNGSGLQDHSVNGTQIGYNTISTSYTSEGINRSLGYADFANGVFKGWNWAENFSVKGRFSFGEYDCGWVTLKYKDHSGNNRTMTILAGRT